jgi:hypothetical protein
VNEEQPNLSIAPTWANLGGSFRAMLAVLRSDWSASGKGKTRDKWDVTADMLESLAIGAGILGTGGGNPYFGMLEALQQLKAGRSIQVFH